MGLMWVSVLLFIGALFAIVRFLRNASDAPDDAHDWPAEADLEGMRVGPRRCTQRCFWVGLLAFVVAMALSYVAFAHRPPVDRGLPPNGVLWTAEALLRDFFPSSEQVAYERIQPPEKQQLREPTRVLQENDTQVLFVARSRTRVDGYALLSEAAVDEAPAAFGVQLSAEGGVKRVEVMRLLDPGQQNVLDPRFLNQFEGRTITDVSRLHRQVARPAQCSSACSAATEVVRRALVLVSQFQSNNNVETGSAPPHERR